MGSREPAVKGSEPALLEILEATQTQTIQDELPNTPTALLNPASCALCLLVSQSVVRGLKSFFSEFVNDPKSREAFRSSRGFCRDHTRLLHATGDALGIAILYSDLADATLNRWKSSAAVKHSAFIRRSSTRLAQCPACVLELEANSRYSGALAFGLSDETVWSCIAERLQICTSHVEQVARLAKPAHAERLYSIAATKLDRMRGELNEIILKNDYRYRGEEWGAERDAWIRALELVTRPSNSI